MTEEFTGKDMYIAWVHSGGTVVLSSDYRTAAYTPTVDLVDASAGNDTHKTYLVALKDGKFAVTFLGQTDGETDISGLAEGTGGTLMVGPQGSASGKPKRTIPAISMGAQRNYPYNEIVEINVEFQQNGERTDATW